MYDWLKRLILPWLRIHDSEPHPPSGYDPHEMLRIERADGGFLRLRLLGWRLYALAWGCGVSVVSIALLVADWRLSLLVVPLVAFAIVKAAILYVTMRLDYEMRWYVITDRSLLVREGVWNVQEITLTFANAQNVRITQGPLERWFGISTVEVETAGGASVEGMDTGHRASLRGLKNPQEVRSVILDLLKKQRTAGLGDPDDLEARAVAMRDTDAAPLSAGDAGSATIALLQDVWAQSRTLRGVMEQGVRPLSLPRTSGPPADTVGED